MSRSGYSLRRKMVSAIAIVVLLTLAVNAHGQNFHVTVSTANAYNPGALVVVQGNLTSDGSPVANALIAVEVRNPSGSSTGPGGNVDIVSTDSMGKYTSQYRLPSNAAVGTYEVKAVYKANVNASTSFSVTVEIPSIDTELLKNTSTLLDANGNPATSFKGNDEIGAKSSVKADVEGKVVYIVLLKDPEDRILYPIYKFTFTASATPQSPEATYVLPANAARGTWTVRIQVTAIDGTPLALMKLSFTVT